MKTTQNATITTFSELATYNNFDLNIVYYDNYNLILNNKRWDNWALKYRASFQDIGHPGILIINYNYYSKLYLIIIIIGQEYNDTHMKKNTKKIENKKNNLILNSKGGKLVLNEIASNYQEDTEIYWKNIDKLLKYDYIKKQQNNRLHPSLNRIITS